MADRIKQIKSESRRMPKQPLNAYDGPRRISHGIIGVRKVRRSSVKSNTSTGSRNNPFADLVPTKKKKRSSISSQSSRTKSEPINASKVSKAQKLEIVHKNAMKQFAVQQALAAKADANTTLQEASTPSPIRTLDHKDIEDSSTRATAHSTPILPASPKLSCETLPTSPLLTLEDGFVQEDDEMTMEIMAMDKIDRFLESLGGQTNVLSHPESYSKNSDTEDVKSIANVVTAAESTQTPDVSSVTSKLQLHTEAAPSESSWISSIQSHDDDDARSSTTRSIRPLSIQKSPTSEARPQHTTVDPEEMFRGVKVQWLLQMYHDYMAEKSTKTSTTPPTSPKRPSPPAAKGLRPLILPVVVGSTEDSELPTSPIDAHARAETGSVRRPLPKRTLTFGSSAQRPALLSQKTSPTSPSPSAKPVRPASIARSNTGLTQKDAVELARVKMNTAVDSTNDHFIAQVIEATTMLMPSSPVTETPPAVVRTQPLSPLRDTFATPPTASSEPLASPAVQPALKQEQGYFDASSKPLARISSTHISKKLEDRKRIVSNNVSFYDPFANTAPVSPPPPALSPALSEANLLMNRQFLASAQLANPTAFNLDQLPIPQDNFVLQTEPRPNDYDSEIAKPDVQIVSAITTTARPDFIQRESHYSDDSTSEDDDLLPKQRRRPDMLGVSAKAQKLLGMSDSLQTNNRAQDDRPEVAPKASTQTGNRLVNVVRKASLPTDRLRAKASPKTKESLNGPQEKRVSNPKTLLEPFDEATYSEQLKEKTDTNITKQVSTTGPLNRTKSSQPSEFHLKPALKRLSTRGSSLSQQTGETGLIAVKIDEPLIAPDSAVSAPKNGQDFTNYTMNVDPFSSVDTPNHTKQMSAIVHQTMTAPAANPPQSYSVFGNYHIDQDQPHVKSNNQPSMSPNEGTASTELKAPSPTTNAGPQGIRKVSRGRHGRLSVIEQSPQTSSNHSQRSGISSDTSKAPSIHGLGLGMSPPSGNIFDQILQADNSTLTKGASNRMSTLDRINKSAKPAHSKTASNVSGSEHSVEVLRHIRPNHPEEPSDSAKAVPITYYQPQVKKQTIDPFRNLDMKTVTASRPISSNTKPTSSSAKPKSANRLPSQQEQARVSSDSSGSYDKNYIATAMFDEPGPSRPPIPRTMSRKIRKEGRPASLMAASEVHEKFDIRRALARSDDGDSDDDSRPFQSASSDDTFGTIANTATQAFSKWFG